MNIFDLFAHYGHLKLKDSSERHKGTSFLISKLKPKSLRLLWRLFRFGLRHMINTHPDAVAFAVNYAALRLAAVRGPKWLRYFRKLALFLVDLAIWYNQESFCKVFNDYKIRQILHNARVEDSFWYLHLRDFCREQGGEVNEEASKE